MSSLSEVLGTFTNPHTAQLYDRQLSVLRRLVRDSKEGFYYRQLSDVCALLDLVWERIELNSGAFVPPFCELVALCALPVLRERSNEEFLGGLADFERLVSTLVKFLDAQIPTVQVATAETLRIVSLGKDSLRSNHPPTKRVLGTRAPVQEDLRPLPKDLNQSILFKAGAVAGVVAAITKQVAQLTASEQPPASNDSLGGGGASEGASMRGDSSVGGSTREGSGGGGESYGSTSRGGYIAIRMPRDDDDEDDDDDGMGGELGAVDEGVVKVPTAALKAELVSAMPKPTRVLFTSLINLLKSLSASSSSSAAVVVAGGVGATMELLQMLVNEPRDPLVSACVEVLWNCVEHSCDALENGPPARSRTELLEKRRQASAMYALSTEQNLTILLDLFGHLLEAGHAQQAKELRNEVLIVASFVARQKRSHELFRSTGFLSTLLAYATAGETSDFPSASSSGTGAAMAAQARTSSPSSEPVADLHHFATSQPVDLELKRILWALISDLSRYDPLNLAVVVESPMLHVLLVYLNVDLQLTPENAFEAVSALSRRSRRSPTGNNDDDGNANPWLMQESEADGDCEQGRMANVEEEKNKEGEAYDDYDERSAQGSNYSDEQDFFPMNNGNGHNNAPSGGGREGGGSVTPLSVRRLPRTQLRVLQQQAMSVLLNLTPRAPDTFKALAGHVITLRFLDACSSESSGENARGLVQGALMLLLSFVGLPGLQEELGHLDAVRIMLSRFNDTSAPSALRADAVCILSRLCSNHKDNQAGFRRDGGIVSLVTQLEDYARARQPAPRLKRSSSSPPSGGGFSGSATEKVSPLLVGVVDCLWNAVVGNNPSTARFLAVGGLDALLNLLEVCPVLMRHQVAGLVADLAENSSVVPALKAWQSDRTMVAVVPLLLGLFCDEEVRLGFDRPQGGGAIANLWAPLRRHAEAAIAEEDAANASASAANAANAGQGGRNPSSSSSSHSGGSAGAKKSFARLATALQQSASAKAERALRRAVEAQDLRAKISAILSHLGYDYANDVLAGDAAHRATLLMCEHYVSFRAGEAWGQVRRELLVEGTKPIAADAFLLESKLEACFNSARAVQRAQARLGNECTDAAQNREQAFFDSVKQQRDQEIRLAQIKRSLTQPKKKKLFAATSAPVSPSSGGSAAPENGSHPEGSLSVAVLPSSDQEAPSQPA